MLPILYQQHVQYNAELARTHSALGKLYKKLAKVEIVLAEREERNLSRNDRKKIQWTRTLAKRGIGHLEMEQACYQHKLEHLGALISSYEQIYNAPMTPWTGQMPPSPFAFTPFSAIASPWTSHTSQPSSDGQSETRPTQFWDLSMLPEQCEYSPFGSPADSGYHEPPVHGLSRTNEPLNATPHVFVHEMVQPTFDTTFAEPSSLGNGSRGLSPTSEDDDVPALQTPVSPARLGAQSTKQHKRSTSCPVAT